IAPPGDTQYIVSSGWASSAFGTAVLVNITKVIAPGGIAPPPPTGPNADRQIPDPTIAWRYQFAYPTGIAPQTWTNTHYIAWEIQYIDQAGRGWDSAQLGQP